MAAPDDLPTDGGDDPYSSISLFHSTAPLLGALIGVVTLLLPVASVLGSRSPATLLARPESAHGLAQPAGLAGTGPGEPGGGDPRRQQQ